MSTNRPEVLKVLSYNIHKGFDFFGRNFVIDEMREAIHDVHADIVFLQEVQEHHDRRFEVNDGALRSKLEFLADSLWPHFAYGKNAVYTRGHHGNAILSKYPFSFWENIDVTTHSLQRRGILHGIIEIDSAQPLHLICLHFDLFERGREKQLAHLCRHIQEKIPSDAPLLVVGDFNDWRGSATHHLEKELDLREVFQATQGHHVGTFPSWFPILRLDRIYYRGLQCLEGRKLHGPPWSRLSDHVALYAEVILEDKILTKAL